MPDLETEEEAAKTNILNKFSNKIKIILMRWLEIN